MSDVATNSSELFDFCEAQNDRLFVKGKHAKVSFDKSPGFDLCVDYVRKFGPPDRQSVKNIVYGTGRDLIREARRLGVIDSEGSIVTSKKYSMYKMAMYTLNGIKSGSFFADLEPISPDFEPRLRGGRRTSIAVPTDLYNDFSALKRLYRLTSDGELVVHLVIVAATLMRLKQEHQLVMGVSSNLEFGPASPGRKGASRAAAG